MEIGEFLVKWVLVLLNGAYIIAGGVILYIAFWGWPFSFMVKIGMIVTGAIIIVVALVGIAGAIMEAKVALNVSSFVLILMFLAVLSLSIFCLVTTAKQKYDLSKYSWENLGNDSREELQKNLLCCGFDNATDLKMRPPTCTLAQEDRCCGRNSTKKGLDSLCVCPPCGKKLHERLSGDFVLYGIVGIGIAVALFIGVVLATCLRNYINKRDPARNYFIPGQRYGHRESTRDPYDRRASATRDPYGRRASARGGTRDRSDDSYAIRSEARRREELRKEEERLEDERSQLERKRRYNERAVEKREEKAKEREQKAKEREKKAYEREVKAYEREKKARHRLSPDPSEEAGSSRDDKRSKRKDDKRKEKDKDKGKEKDKDKGKDKGKDKDKDGSRDPDDKTKKNRFFW